MVSRTMLTFNGLERRDGGLAVLATTILPMAHWASNASISRVGQSAEISGMPVGIDYTGTGRLGLFHQGHSGLEHSPRPHC